MIRKKRVKRKIQPRIIANYFIRYPQVRVLDESGKMIGLMSSREAQQKAQYLNKDLVLITDKAELPIVKIIDLSKFKYQLQQKEAKNRKKNKAVKIKEIRFRIFIGEKDFESKLNKMKHFLEKGNKVKISLEFKGRQIAKKDLAYEMFNKIFIKLEDLAVVENEAKIIGTKLIAQVAPIKK